MKGGNCIDAVVLFALCFEAMTLDTFVVLLRDRALACRRENLGDSEKFFTLETTVVGSTTFEESLRIAEGTLQRNAPAPFG